MTWRHCPFFSLDTNTVYYAICWYMYACTHRPIHPHTTDNTHTEPSTRTLQIIHTQNHPPANFRWYTTHTDPSTCTLQIQYTVPHWIKFANSLWKSLVNGWSLCYTTLNRSGQIQFLIRPCLDWKWSSWKQTPQLCVVVVVHHNTRNKGLDKCKYLDRS